MGEGEKDKPRFECHGPLCFWGGLGLGNTKHICIYTSQEKTGGGQETRTSLTPSLLFPMMQAEIRM
jgi:hypothetical protein